MTAATEALVVLARVRTGEADAARGAIAEHWPADASPFARVPGTHLARLQLLTPPARRLRGRRRTPAEHVLLAADGDAPAAAWLEGLRVAAAGALDAVLGHCAFYPGTREPAAFARWIAANRLEVGFSVVGSPGATAADVRAALDLREEVAAFAERTQGIDPTALRTAWRAWRAAA
jgi:hypothetical protein